MVSTQTTYLHHDYKTVPDPLAELILLDMLDCAFEEEVMNHRCPTPRILQDPSKDDGEASEA